jgi:hypothetical protein
MLRTLLVPLTAVAAVEESLTDEVVSLLQLNADWRAGSRIRDNFETSLCSGPQALNFGTATLLHSNLGGQGPDAGDAKLVFGNVVPNVNLEVTNTSVYTPFQNANGGVKHNKISMGFGQINVATDTTVDLKFRFVDASTGELTDKLDRYVFTVLDTDGGAAHGSSESVTITGYESYAAGDDVKVDEKSTFSSTFTSMMRGGRFDNPLGPMQMNQLQERRSVSFVFGNPEFSMTVAESNYANPQGRNILFAGATGALCGEQAKCTSLDCRQFDLLPKADAEFLTCISGHCSESDKEHCCQAMLTK